MAILQSPPSRFRIEERGRRLVVIDTQTGKHSDTTPVRAAETGKQIGTWGPVMRDKGGEDFLLRYAGLFTQNKLDRKGRIVLKTLRLYDKAGPRLIALEPPAARRFAMLGMVQVAAILVILFVWIATNFVATIILGVIFFQLNKRISGAIMKAIIASSAPADLE
ncbi:MAG: hypothetical protein RL367_421 [Pseudomonadota bacterium]|jgi:hypothetical protein